MSNKTTAETLIVNGDKKYICETCGSINNVCMGKTECKTCGAWYETNVVQICEGTK